MAAAKSGNAGKSAKSMTTSKVSSRDGKNLQLPPPLDVKNMHLDLRGENGEESQLPRKNSWEVQIDDAVYEVCFFHEDFGGELWSLL